jgi:hypothetical protein
MTDSNGNTQEVVIGAGADVMVHYGAAKVMLHPGGGVEVYTAGDVEVHADGAVAAYTSGEVDAYTNKSVRVHSAANDGPKTSRAEQQIGDKMQAGHPHAGWIYAGISKTTHQPFYVAPKDSGVFKWKEAMTFAANDGSRVPSQDELDQIYEARNKGALKGTFNVTGSGSAGWYWSARDNNYVAWAQRFSDGQGNNRNDYSSLRCVR